MLGLRIDNVYNDLLDKQASLLFKSAETFRMAILDPERTDMYIAKIDAIQSEVSEASHDLVKRVVNAFITPYDKEDIHALSRQVLHICETFYFQLQLFDQIKDIKNLQHVAPFTEILIELTGNIKESVNYLRNKNTRENLIDHLRSFHRLKHEALSHYVKFVSYNLNSTEYRTKIKLRILPIFNSFESLLNHMTETTDLLEKMSIKYG